MPDQPAPEIRMLLEAIERGYDRQSWHGTNLKGSLRGVEPEVASWRPQPERHNVWELVVHAAYWKYIVWRRLTGSARGGFPLQGSDWWTRPEPTEDGGERTAKELAAAWKEDRQLLDRMHGDLRQAVAELKPRYLEKRPGRTKMRLLDLVTGIAAHDLYHAGQIQLLKRMHGEGAR